MDSAGSSSGGWTHSERRFSKYPEGYFRGMVFRILLPSVIPDSVRAITNIKYISDNTAYAVGAYNLSNVSGRTSGAVNIMKLAKNNRASLGVSFSPGYSAVILKTTDGGSSWFTFGNVPDDYNYLYQLEFIDPANFLMIGTHQTNNNFTG